MPIPIVKTAAGWHFDTRGAPEEMRIRRIGRNELAAIQVALAYTDAQKEYHARDWNGDGVLQYATRGLSSRGQARRPVLGLVAGRAREPARRPVRRSQARASRITATCTRSSPRKARMRPAAREAT